MLKCCRAVLLYEDSPWHVFLSNYNRFCSTTFSPAPVETARSAAVPAGPVVAPEAAAEGAELAAVAVVQGRALFWTDLDIIPVTQHSGTTGSVRTQPCLHTDWGIVFRPRIPISTNMTSYADLKSCVKTVAYVVHFFSGSIYSRGLKFLQVIYESFDCDLTQGFFYSCLL